MDIFILALLLGGAAVVFKAQIQRKRIVLLAHYLQNYQLEKLMEILTQGYLRALDETDVQRRTQIWEFLASTETQLCEQFQRFAVDFAKADAQATRVSKLPIFIPLADTMLPNASFDARRVFAIHAQGISDAVLNSQERSPKDKAIVVMAELFLMQHSCHWFCKSKLVASARMLMRHQTPYEQLLASVGAQTRRAYTALVGN